MMFSSTGTQTQSTVANIIHEQGSRVQTQVHYSYRKLSSTSIFDSTNKDHLVLLKDWCTEQWSTTFQRSLLSSNVLYYHSCCCAFSRRGFSKTAGHPSHQTQSVRKLEGFKEVSSADELFDWLLKLIKNNQMTGRECYFPSINSFHFPQQTITDTLEMKPHSEREFLTKRVDELIQENCKLKNKINTIVQENKQLLYSSKSWHSKYQDLLESPLNTISETRQTPQKLTKLNKFDDFLNDSYFCLPSASIFLGDCFGVL